MKLINIIILLVIVTVGCNNNEPITVNPFKDMLKIYSGATSINAYKVDVYLAESPFVGYNNIYVDVFDSVTQARPADWDLSFSPIMTMMMNGNEMKHSCPLEQPQFVAELKAYAGASVFVMPTTPMGNWRFEINYVNTMGEGNISFPIAVTEKENPAMISFVSEADETTKYFVALIEPQKPDVGTNDFEIGIYTKESMMRFPAVDDHTVHINPEMPSMGHGSPNNVDPVDEGNGHYKGSVNFTMTGLWRINMSIKDQDLVPVGANKYFEIAL